MSDDHHSTPRMLCSDAAECSSHSFAQRLVRLPALPAVSALVPPAHALGIAFLDLGPRKPLPLADVDLAELPVEHDGSSDASPDDLGGLACPRQVARVDRDDRLAGELVCERARLLAAGAVQAWICMALEATVAVPVRFSVAHQQELGHRQLG